MTAIESERLDYDEAAAYLKWSKRELRDAKVAGLVACEQFGRRVWFTKADLDEFRLRCRREAVTDVRAGLPSIADRKRQAGIA